MTIRRETGLIIERRGPVVEVAIDRPESRNALTFALQNDFDEVLNDAESDSEVRVVTLAGVGPIFSSGFDLKEIAPIYSDAAKVSERQQHERRSLPRAWHFRKILVAAVHGYVGPAAQHFLAPFDFVLAAEGTRFSFEQARLGGGGQGGTILPFLLPMRVLKKFWLMGGWLDADQALTFQYVQRVVKEADLLGELRRWADQAAAVPPEQVASAKEGIHRIYEICGLLGVVGIGNRTSGHGSVEDREFFRSVSELGLKEALRVRDAAFDKGIARV